MSGYEYGVLFRADGVQIGGFRNAWDIPDIRYWIDRWEEREVLPACRALTVLSYVRHPDGRTTTRPLCGRVYA